MTLSSDRKVLSCPYCESTELIIESDSVTKQRIKSDAYKEVQFSKDKTKKDKKSKKDDVMDADYEEK